MTSKGLDYHLPHHETISLIWLSPPSQALTDSFIYYIQHMAYYIRHMTGVTSLENFSSTFRQLSKYWNKVVSSSF